MALWYNGAVATWYHGNLTPQYKKLPRRFFNADRPRGMSSLSPSLASRNFTIESLKIGQKAGILSKCHPKGSLDLTTPEFSHRRKKYQNRPQDTIKLWPKTLHFPTGIKIKVSAVFCVRCLQNCILWRCGFGSDFGPILGSIFECFGVVFSIQVWVRWSWYFLGILVLWNIL